MRRGKRLLTFTSIYFNPRTSCEVRLATLVVLEVIPYFNPRTSCEVRPFAVLTTFVAVVISIHAPHARCDGKKLATKLVIITFQSTHLMRGATFILVIYWSLLKFQSTHLMRGATFYRPSNDNICEISIHAPHARCDGTQTISLEGYFDFNPRTSCEVRQYARVFLFLQVQFQSTHLMRGATLLTTSARQTDLFQSTHLMRGATGIGIDFFNKYHISIHAPHARCDCWLKRAAEELAYFNPRTSCEVRPRSPRNVRSGRHFNPRTSCEVRQVGECYCDDCYNFNPRTSCEVRR